MKTDFDYPELAKEKALKKIVKLFEEGYFVAHTNIAKEFGIKQDTMRKFLQKQPNNLFAEIKAQNRRITFEKLQVRGAIRHLEKKRNGIEPEVLFTEHDRHIFKEVRKKAKVIVKLPNENDLDFKLFKNKAVGGVFPKDYKGTFKEYVCGVGRKQINY